LLAIPAAASMIVGADPVDPEAPTALTEAATLSCTYDPAAATVDEPVFRLGAMQDDAPPADDAAPIEGEVARFRSGDLLPTAVGFGSEGSSRWYVHGGGGTNDANDNLFLGGVGYAYFIAEGLSLNVELNAAGFDQKGKDAGGLNFNVLFQWHFIMERGWSLFIDGGAGLLGTWDDVPRNGTKFNFTPQAGGGWTLELSDTTRLVLGARWHHISNANLGSHNPGRDSLFMYGALSFAF
jgi:hypothetical protein